MEKEALMHVFELFDTNISDDLKAIHNYLKARNIRINFKIDNTIFDPAQYNRINKDIFKGSSFDVGLDSLYDFLDGKISLEMLRLIHGI